MGTRPTASVMKVDKAPCQMENQTAPVTPGRDHTDHGSSTVSTTSTMSGTMTTATTKKALGRGAKRDDHGAVCRRLTRRW